MDKVIEMLEKVAYTGQNEELNAECRNALEILKASRRAAIYYTGNGKSAYTEPVVIKGVSLEFKIEAYPATLYAEMCDMIQAG